MKTITAKQPMLSTMGNRQKSIDLKGIIMTVVETLKTWKERSEQRRQLVNLDDRMLKDIGISRSQAVNEFHKKVWEL